MLYNYLIYFCYCWKFQLISLLVPSDAWGSWLKPRWTELPSRSIKQSERKILMASRTIRLFVSRVFVLFLYTFIHGLGVPSNGWDEKGETRACRVVMPGEALRTQRMRVPILFSLVETSPNSIQHNLLNHTPLASGCKSILSHATWHSSLTRTSGGCCLLLDVVSSRPSKPNNNRKSQDEVTKKTPLAQPRFCSRSSSCACRVSVRSSPKFALG